MDFPVKVGDKKNIELYSKKNNNKEILVAEDTKEVFLLNKNKVTPIISNTQEIFIKPAVVNKFIRNGAIVVRGTYLEKKQDKEFWDIFWTLEENAQDNCFNNTKRGIIKQNIQDCSTGGSYFGIKINYTLGEKELKEDEKITNINFKKNKDGDLIVSWNNPKSNKFKYLVICNQDPRANQSLMLTRYMGIKEELIIYKELLDCISLLQFYVILERDEKEYENYSKGHNSVKSSYYKYGLSEEIYLSSEIKSGGKYK